MIASLLQESSNVANMIVFHTYNDNKTIPYAIFLNVTINIPLQYIGWVQSPI